ncbi:MAG: ferredoxin--NADP reductase [Flavobacteriaceae bacterium]|nr:ferredoxin--NADP reductase [Flavobacteriaceae bacterium]
MTQFYPLVVNRIKRETEKAVCISFEIPAHLKSAFSFIAGQYLTLRTNINGEEIRRAYSICASPNSGLLQIAVKEIENGRFSTYLNRKLQVHDIIEVAPPQGRFTFEPNSAAPKTIAAFAAGSGITPIMSIAKSVLEHEAHSRFVLVYGNKTPEDMIFLEAILELQAQYSERFKLQNVFSQVENKNALYGRIDKSTVNFILQNTFKEHTIDTFYLCGPEAMIDTVSETLKSQGFDAYQINFELFTQPLKDTVDSALIVPSGATEITVIVDDDEDTFTMAQTTNILEASLDEGIDAPYSCQGGICSSCIARVIDGTATMRQNNILTDNEVAEGLILTCQAYPTSEQLTVDYDDV